MAARRNHIDRLVLLTVLFLMVASTVVVYSASSSWALQKYGAPSGLAHRHVVKVLIGMAVMFVAMNIRYEWYRRLTKPALLVCLFLLMVTLAAGGEIKGASRWLSLGGFNIQPSEAAKFALIFHLSALLAVKREKVRDLNLGFIPLLLWVGGVVILVMVQPNFSTGAIILSLGVVMMFVGGARLKHMVLTVGAMLPLLLLYMVSADYRMKRVLAFLGFADGTAELSKANYQLWQGIIGFGNGGIFGVGMGASKQRDLFLPESYGDFVFSIVGEEYGLIGTMLFLAAFLIILLRGLRIARNAPDEFSRYLSVGITCTIVVYALGNALVTLGLFPTTGLPMPFVSYGGSSIVLSSFAIGVLLNVSSHTDLHPRRPETVSPGGDRETHEPAVGKVY